MYSIVHSCVRGHSAISDGLTATFRTRTAAAPHQSHHQWNAAIPAAKVPHQLLRCCLLPVFFMFLFFFHVSTHSYMLLPASRGRRRPRRARLRWTDGAARHKRLLEVEGDRDRHGGMARTACELTPSSSSLRAPARADLPHNRQANVTTCIVSRPSGTPAWHARVVIPLYRRDAHAA
jgi:hypothetical protein